MPLFGRKRKYSKKQKLELQIDPKLAREVAATLFLIFGLLFLLSLFGFAGSFGQVLFRLITILFGWTAFLSALMLIFLGIVLFVPEKIPVKPSSWGGIGLFFIVLPSIIHLFIDTDSAINLAKEGKGGGLVGYLFSFLFSNFLGFWASFIILIGLLIIAIMLIFQIPISSIWAFLKSLWPKRFSPDIKIQQEGIPVMAMMKKKGLLEKTATTLSGEYQFPSLDLLEDPKGSP